MTPPLPPLVYLDPWLLVLLKPSGLLSTPGRGPEKADCAAARVQARYEDALIVHRLDQPTSGLMIMARDKETHAALSRLFRERAVDKRYRAICSGHLAHDEGEIDAPLRADWPNRPRQEVHPEGKPSRTRYRVLARDTRGALPTTHVALYPITGRSHQLRVHLAWLGHPILGDCLYADETARTAADRLLLHAEALAFTHPVTGERLSFEEPPLFGRG